MNIIEALDRFLWNLKQKFASKEDLSEITDLIPDDASPSNQLADKAYVTNGLSTKQDTLTTDQLNAISQVSVNTQAISDINDKIPNTTTDSNQLVNEEQLANAMEMNAAAVIGSNEEMSQGFELQSFAYSKLYQGFTFLDTRDWDRQTPWYKNADGTYRWYKNYNGAIVGCGPEVTEGGVVVKPEVYVDINDQATVLKDETLFYFISADDFKYQRIKDGNPVTVSGWGKINLPGPSASTTLMTAELHVEINGGMIWFLDDSHVRYNENIIYTCNISDLELGVDSVSEYLVGTGTDITDISGDPNTTYDLLFPTTRYICTVAQTETTMPKWTFLQVVHGMSFTPGQMETINSGATKALVKQITTNANAIDAILDDPDINSFGDVKSELANKQDTLTFDNVPQEDSANPVTSDGIWRGLGTKQNTLTFDDAPTANSNNPVKSSGIKEALDNIEIDITQTSPKPANGNIETVFTKGDGTSVTISTPQVDSSLSPSSDNTIRNSAVTAALSTKVNKTEFNELDKIAVTTKGIRDTSSIINGVYFDTSTNIYPRNKDNINWEVTSDGAPKNTYYKFYDISGLSKVYITASGYTVVRILFTGPNYQMDGNPISIARAKQKIESCASGQKFTIPGDRTIEFVTQKSKPTDIVKLFLDLEEIANTTNSDFMFIYFGNEFAGCDVSTAGYKDAYDDHLDSESKNAVKNSVITEQLTDYMEVDNEDLRYIFEESEESEECI